VDFSIEPMAHAAIRTTAAVWFCRLFHECRRRRALFAANRDALFHSATIMRVSAALPELRLYFFLD
jgi:hypothetical protein